MLATPAPVAILSWSRKRSVLEEVIVVPTHSFLTCSLLACRLADYLAEIRAELGNASAINGGLKMGIEYRLPSGCIVELDALYAGDPIGQIITPSSRSTRQPTEEDCCQACR